jgi:transcriptional regulator with XRE-family HTH domain
MRAIVSSPKKLSRGLSKNIHAIRWYSVLSLLVIFGQATTQLLRESAIDFAIMASRGRPAAQAGEETFGQRLARLRKAAGLSQQQLAKHLGTTQTLVSEYEHDNRRVHGERLAKIASLLRVSADELLGHRPPKANDAPSLKLIRRLKAIEALPPQRQKFVLQTLDALLRDSARSKDG